MIGQFIHTYQITQRLGEGGMGVVYKATDTVLGREVALKMLHGQLIRQSQFLERFKKEARVLAQLLHPNIAVIYNFIEQNENHFMVMEYVQGRNLDELLSQNQTISYEQVVAIFIQALEGLQHAHKKGVYHRDIKPSNFILSPDGTVKLMDFGIAKIAGEQRLTQVNRVVGTIEFMAPELIEGKDPSISSDIYAAGVTMYELLSGKLPFQGNTDFNLMQEILKTKPISLDKLSASIPKTLSTIVMKALEKKPENRFEDARAFRTALLQAFPASKDVDLSQMHRSQPFAPATQIIDLSSKGQQSYKPTAYTDSPATAMQETATVGNRVQHFIEKRKWLLAALLLLLAISGGAIIRKLNSTDIIADANKTDSVKSNIEPNKLETGTGIPSGRTDSFENSGDGPGIGPNKTTKIILPEDEVPKENKEEKKEREKAKEKEKKEVEKKQIINEQPPATEPEKKQIVPEPEKKKEPEKPEETREKFRPAKNNVLIEDKLRIVMRLRDNVSESSVQAGQSLTFIINDPVKYSGHIVVSAGSIANGFVKSVNGKKIVVVVNSVRAVDGQTIEFQERDANMGGNLFNSKSCWAITKKGYKINY